MQNLFCCVALGSCFVKKGKMKGKMSLSEVLTVGTVVK